MKRSQTVSHGHPLPAIPFVLRTMVEVAPPSISPKVSADVQAIFRALRPHARARNTLSESGASLGRADWRGARAGEQLAADGIRLSVVCPAVLLPGSLAVRPGTVTPWVGAGRSSRSGAGRAPADSSYQPTDPQIAFHLARFIEDVRGLPADGIVLRQDWLRAYNFTTDRGAAALNDYARTNDPFANLGKLQISVEVSSVIRASPELFRVAWIRAASYENGSLSATERWTAILTVVIDTPRDADRLRKNPLGVLRQCHQLVEGAWAMSTDYQSCSPERSQGASNSARVHTCA